MICFETRQARFNEEGIEFLRNRYVYKKLEYQEMQKITLVKGYLIKNRALVGGLGLVLIICAISVIVDFKGGYPELHNIKTPIYFGGKGGALMMIFGPAMGVISGISAIYVSILRSPIAIVQTKYESQHVRLRKIQRQGKFEELIHFLNQRVRLENKLQNQSIDRAKM